MKDIEIILENKIGQLALLGETLGKHKISLEGGGVFTYKNVVVAHFLVEDAEKAKQVLKEVGINLIKINEVIIQKLRQDVPGQLGQFCKRLAEENISILVQYSDHSNQLIIVPDHLEKAKQVSKLWMQEWWTY